MRVCRRKFQPTPRARIERLASCEFRLLTVRKTRRNKRCWFCDRTALAEQRTKQAHAAKSELFVELLSIISSNVFVRRVFECKIRFNSDLVNSCAFHTARFAALQTSAASNKREWLSANCRLPFTCASKQLLDKRRMLCSELGMSRGLLQL